MTYSQYENLGECSHDQKIKKNAGQKIKVSPSAIWDHINRSGHAASVEDFSVLDRANNDFDLLIRESLLILHDRPSLKGSVQW